MKVICVRFIDEEGRGNYALRHVIDPKGAPAETVLNQIREHLLVPPLTFQVGFGRVPLTSHHIMLDIRGLENFDRDESRTVKKKMEDNGIPLSSFDEFKEDIKKWLQ